MPTTMTAIGTLKKKSQRHEPWATTHPPATGPMAPAIALNADHVPMAAPRSFAVFAALMSERLPGTSRAAPAPCRARAAMRNRASGARPHAADASANTATPVVKMRLLPYRSPSAPPTSTSDESRRAYASTTHCARSTVIRSSRWITGRATFTTVASRNAMLEPRIAAARVQRRSRSDTSFGAVGEVAGGPRMSMGL